MRFSYSLLLTFVSIFVVSITSYAQSGRISGTIVDGETGDPLFSASVLVVETSSGAVADFDGNYLIKDLQPGSYTLRVSYISYATQTITDVVVIADEVTKIDIAMQTEGVNLEEVVVSAGAILNNEAGLLRQRQKAIAFSDAISAETISKSGAGDAAAAMTKVVGASVVGGKYVYVRGLGDRYSNTLLNGIELPTSDPDRKAFQLDLFPSSLLENIVTVKTFTPDKPGTFSGGLVDVSTKDIPDYRYLTISSSATFNSSTTGKDILLGTRTDNDWLGIADDSRNRPATVRALSIEDFPNSINARRDINAAQQLDMISKSFNSEMIPSLGQAAINQSYSIAHGNRFDLKDNSIGYNASFNYSNSYKNYTDGVGGRYELIGVDYASTNELDTKKEFQSDSRGSHSVDWGALASVSAVINKTNKVTFTAIRTQSGVNQGRFLTGYWQDSPSATYRTQVNSYVDRALLSFQGRGRHEFTRLNGVQLNWNVSTNTNSQNQPDLRFFESQVSERVINGQTLTFYQNPASLFPRPSRFFRDLAENNQTLQTDLTIPFKLNELDQEIKAGYSFQATDRDFREYRYDVYEGSSTERYTEFNGDDVAYFSNLGVVNNDFENPVIGTYFLLASSERSNYDAAQDISAWYVMVNLRLTPWLNIIGGVREESIEMEVISQDPGSPEGRLNNKDLLPSINTVFSLGEKSNLRLAYTNTIARPTFRELAPYVSFDFAGDNLFRGSSIIERTLIKNLDARYELYPNSGEVISMSFFYKWLEQPIERIIDPTFGGGSSTLNETIQNVPSGNVYGVEFELRKNLGFISDNLKDFSFSSNLTFVKSEVDISDKEMIIIRTIKDDAKSTRPLLGQSPFIINLDLAYSNSENGFSSTLSYNYFDDRLSKVTIGAAPDIYEEGFGTFNIALNKEIGKYLTFKLSGKNLLNSYFKEKVTFKGQEYIYYGYKEGRSYGISVSYNL